MRRSLVVASAALLLGASVGAPVTASPPREERLPNVFAYPLTSLIGPKTGRLYSTPGQWVNPYVVDGCLAEERVAGAERCLRFWTQIANLDRGPLELALRVEASGRNVYQVVDGAYRPAGTFTVDPATRELALEDFWAVRLWRFDGRRTLGRPVAASGARDLCPAYGLLPPNEEVGCLGWARHGPAGPELVVGLPWLVHRWYRPHRVGQFIEISGVPDGTYVLEIEIDLGDHIAESYEPDNSTCSVIRLKGDGARALRNDYCWPDRTRVRDRNRVPSA